MPEPEQGKPRKKDAWEFDEKTNDEQLTELYEANEHDPMTAENTEGSEQAAEHGRRREYQHREPDRGRSKHAGAGDAAPPDGGDKNDGN